jgi:hypothetical protein
MQRLEKLRLLNQIHDGIKPIATVSSGKKCEKFPIAGQHNMWGSEETGVPNLQIMGL